MTSQTKWALSQLETKARGFFIDSGAAMGILGNNTFVLEDTFWWNGICVEPIPEFFDDLVKTRHCHLVQAALSDCNGRASLVVPDNLWLAGLDGKLGDDVWRDARNQATRKIDVATFRIGTLLEKFKAPQTIDYWSLDTEGSELDILKTFPWDRHTVSLLTIEHNQDTPRRTAISSYLAELDYAEVQLTENEFGFVKRV